MTDFEILNTERFGSRSDEGRYCEMCEKLLDPFDDNVTNDDGCVFCSEWCLGKYERMVQNDAVL